MRNGRTSRNGRPRPTIVSSVMPSPPRICTLRSTTRQIASEQITVAMPDLWPRPALIEHPGRVPNDEPRGVQAHLIVGEHVTTGHPVITSEDWQKSIAKPGIFIIRKRTSKRSSAVPRRAASSRCGC